MTGALTLDLQGDAFAVFIFKIGATLTTASNSSVVFVNSGPSCNVFWQVGSSATLGATTAFQGNILALASITLNTGANMNGRALAQTGAVTLDSNIVSLVCPVAPPPTNTPVPVPTNTPLPIPTNTPVPVPTNTPVPVPTNTPVPLAVELLYFVVSRDGQAVVLDWATAEEVDNLGFNLYRAPVDGFAQAALIHFEPSAVPGGTGAGATYRYRDTLAAEGVWWYWLGDVDTHGSETIHNPSVVIAERLRSQVYLPLMEHNSHAVVRLKEDSVHRHMFVYLIIGLTLVMPVCGARPLVAADAPNAPVGVAETPTSAPIETPAKTETPAPTNKRVPARDHPKIPTEENTATPTPANTLVATPTITATAPVIVGLPNTGGGTPKSGAPSEILVLFTAAVGILGALALGMRILARRLAQR